MTIPSFMTPFIFWRPSKVYGMHKVCITGGSFIPGEYLKGNRPPNYPVPAIPQVFQWDYSLGIMLYTMPVMSEDEWEREEEAWQDYLDSLDNQN